MILRTFYQPYFPYRFSANEPVVMWGHKFDPCPKEFAELLIWAMKKRFTIGEGDAKDRVYNGFYEARIRAKARLRVSC